MSKYSLSEPATIFTTDGEFEFNTSSLNFETYLSSPASEEAEAITSSEATPTSPRNSSSQDTSNSPTSNSPNQPSRNSKQNFLSLFKKKDTSNSINTNPTTKPISALPQQSLVNANILAHDSNLDTTENTVQNNNDLETNHNVSRSIIGSVSVPDLPALNTNALDDEYNAMIKHQASDIGNHASDGTHGLIDDFSGGKPSSISSKKHKKRKNSIVSEKMIKEDSGFKNTMKNTMRKTSTFFKKLGSKQTSDNSSNQSERPPIPDFQVQNSQIVSSNTSHHIPATLNVKNDSLIPEPLSSATTIDDSFSDNSASIDEKELLKRTLQEYSSVYVDYQLDDENDRKSSLYRMSILGANKSVPDNIGRTYSWNAQSSSDTTENIPINTNFATNFFDSKRVSGNTFMSLPVIRSEKKKAESKMVLEEIKTFSLSRVKEEDNEDDVIYKKTSANHSKTNVKRNTKNSMNNESVSTTHIDLRSSSRSTDESSPSRKSSKKSFHSSKSTTSLFTQGSLMAETEEHIALYSSLSAQQRRVVLNKSASHGSIRDMKDEDTIVDNRTLRANLDARGLSMKPRPGSETGTNYRLSQATIPKRPDKKLPDIPNIDLKSEADVSNSRSPHCQASSIASSCYETASGSTATLHTAPPSPVTDIIDPSNSSEGTTPKIHVDDVLFVSSPSPIEVPFDGAQYSFSDVPEKGAGEVSLSEAKLAAKRCFDEDETFVKKNAIAEFLGGTKALQTQALKFYMEYFDFSNLRIDMAFRRLCGKLYIKGETQQVDRILEAFSIRYWECNPKSIYDIVHAIAYSLLLLNTDLHVAQVSTKMSRQQFVRNTMAAIHAQINLAMQESYEDDQSTITSVDTNVTSSTSITARPRRSGSIKSWRSNTNSSMTSLSFIPPSFSRQWDSELESLLKDIYTVIKSNQIVQPFSEPERAQSDPNTLSPTIQRSMSLLGHQSSRINALKKGIAAANARARKNANGKVSPSPSFGSIGSESSLGADSLARSSSQTLPTLSSFSLRHASSSETALTSTIAECNEDEFDDRASIDSTSTSESLELYLSGAPYAKEGLLVRKHYWDSTNKRAKDKYWKECFVVVEKGEIRMYKFDTQNSSGSPGAGAIGGGNWMANATAMGEVSLRHSITNALPPPGYNRSRPHVFALSMSNGGLYFFQAGTAELVDEWVSTCNYWAARMSKEPLTGGVSNMEYGWGRCLEPILDGDEFSDRKSIMSDHRSIMSSGSTYTTDRIAINEWKAPMPPSVSSNLDEAGQLAALKKYKEDLEEELEQHKNFWDPMSKLFSPRSSNHTKAFSNWEKKSQWLLYEIIKYTTYIECIENSIVIREKRRKERAKLKLKEAEINEKVNSLIAAESTDDDEKRKEQKRAELRARARLSMKLLHRATWTPGDGFSLNLPKDLFGEEQLSDGEEESILAESINHNTKPKSGTEVKAVIEDERRIGNVSDSINSGTKWVDRFS
ncbi:11089_t:CDS:10 [Cetraspora pellucida]|uniref:11089_t:CDS:1 n=1 Tax=Cetraspora pellucida TaxID=1433469 RepID=A0ACA9KC83_9GLOM|nr:11089_t:CDS:10 [Cetraspora pellucida]